MSGLLRRGARGMILDADDGGIWTFAPDPSFNGLLDRHVTVEAVQCGPERLEVLWMGAHRQARAG
ncbi:hypothetical protein CLG96_02600 [Sphingomonas oleivorans]|uniref:Uncharacterized protein n=2 Tax=Sphingomonas oleivorans TaxID=1735121 RepID=A0A2T5G1P5_9SPHN|nr:hypothetical protein CLG96_02600 [Sphingomonas oleivorans]